MSRFEEQDRLADELLKFRGVIVVHKAPRSGVTISLVKRSIESGRKVVIVSPTKIILKHVKDLIPDLTKLQPKIACILPNTDLCKKLDPSLKLKFQFKETCNDCEYLDNPQKCLFQSLLLSDFELIGLTYDKLRTLIYSGTEDARRLLCKLWSSEKIFIFDEFTTSLLRDIPTLTIAKKDKNGNIQRLSEKIENLESSTQSIDADEGLDVFLGIIWGFLEQFENVLKNGEYVNESTAHLPEEHLFDIFRLGWRFISNLTKDGKDTSFLQELFLVVLASKKVWVSYDDGEVQVTPVLNDALEYLRKFCRGITEEKSVFVVDSFQADINFESILGRKVKHVLWGPRGDPLDTNSQQLIISDTAHWGEPNFHKDSDLRSRIEEFMKELLHTFPPSKVLVVNTNKKTAQTISRWDLPKEVRITWHRSDLMRGIPVEDRRIMICVSGPYLPKKAYVASSASFNYEDFVSLQNNLSSDYQRFKIINKLRMADTSGEFINAIARVKDPEARERSVVICFGMRKSEIESLLKQQASQHLSKPRIVEPFRKGGLDRDGIWIAKLWFDHANVEVKDLPIVARILSRVHGKRKLRASEVVPAYYERTSSMTITIVEKAEQYEQVLNDYGVEIIYRRGGVIFECVSGNQG